MTITLNILGIIVVLGILYLMSSNKKDINKKMILKAFAIQLVLAFLLVKFPLGQIALQKISDFVTKALTYEADGVSFVFGDLTKGNVFAVNVLANIIFVSALVGALYCLVVIGVVVKLIGVALVPLGSIIVSKILLLETSEEIALREAASTEEVSMDNKGNNPNLISAVSEGDLNGLNMALGIIALVAMVNGVLETFGTSLEQILSYVFAPLGFLQSMIY